MKATLWEGGVRGAACIFSPLIKAHSRVSEAPMHEVDWLPTLYAAAGGNLAQLPKLDGLDQWRMITEGTSSPRNSMLIDIDEVANTEAAIIGRYKLFKGRSNQTIVIFSRISYFQNSPNILFSKSFPCSTGAKDNNEDFYGESGNDRSYPVYRVADALASEAGSAISRIEGFVRPSITQVKKLRVQSAVSCSRDANRANCSNLCLFDILDDSCETVDLSKKQPEVFIKILLLPFYKVYFYA